MYIEPNSTIKILHSVPLDASYKNTIFHVNSGEQEAYFIDRYSKYTLTNQNYQRVGKGKCRVNYKYEDLYDCNYMMFRNESFSTKWFYAFITDITYINKTVSEISYEIDVIQTWFFEFALTVRPCFVEREHSETDDIGDNLILEPVDIGDITCDYMEDTKFFDSYVAVIASAYKTGDDLVGGYVSGLFTGLDYVAGRIDEEEGVNSLLEYLDLVTQANASDSIVAIWVMPNAFYTTSELPSTQVVKVGKPTGIHSYTPRNKKLLTYPYCYLGVDCGNNSAVYRYEYFKDSEDNTCSFTMNGIVTPNPEISLVPVDYNGAEFNYVEKLIMTGFPQVGYSVDSFKAYVASGGLTSDLIGLTGSIAGIAAGATGVAPLGVMGVVGTANNINDIIVASNRPPQARGSSGGSVDIATRTKNFWFKFMCITEQNAKILDDYFDKYGYATNRVKKPNIFGYFYDGMKPRPVWNYIKTKDFNFLSSVPSDDKVKICSIIDNGITFWIEPTHADYGTNVGNYTLSNTPQ